MINFNSTSCGNEDHEHETYVKSTNAEVDQFSNYLANLLRQDANKIELAKQ